MTKTRHVVKAKDALIVYKLRWLFNHQQQQQKCSFQSLAEEYYPSPRVLDKTHHHWHMVWAPYVQLGIPKHMPSEESKRTCLLTAAGAHTGEPPAYPLQDHISQLLPGHGDLGPGTAGAWP